MMQKLANHIIAVILLTGITLFTACDPCPDCGPNNAYPYFNFSILNKTSLDTLNLNVSRLKSEITEIDELIENEEDEEIINTLQASREIKSDSLSYFNKIVGTVNSRLLSIESINGKTDLFYSENSNSDSLSSFRIPLQLVANNSEYSIKILGTGFSDSLKLGYTLEDTVINDKITVTAKSLKVISHTFDSLRGPYGCSKTICISNEQSIYVEI